MRQTASRLYVRICVEKIREGVRRRSVLNRVAGGPSVERGFGFRA
ncbi:hypothetical protein [Streptomyces sp. NPDC001658]